MRRKTMRITRGKRRSTDHVLDSIPQIASETATESVESSASNAQHQKARKSIPTNEGRQGAPKLTMSEADREPADESIAEKIAQPWIGGTHRLRLCECRWRSPSVF